TNIDTIQPKVDNINSEVTFIKTNIDTIQPKVDNISSEVTLIKTNIDTIQPKVDNISSEVKHIKTNIDTIHSKVDNINSEVTLIKTNIDTNQPKVDNINSEVKCIITNIDTIQPKVDIINNEVSFIKSNISDVNKSISQISCLMPSKNCTDLYNKGCKTSEPVQISPYSGSPHDSVAVMCDEDWTIIQRRQDVQPRVNFTRPWADYVHGFGELTGEFWLGLDHLHRLTSHTSNELYIELEDWEDNTRWAKYTNFTVGPAEDKYRLTVTGYTGNAGDALEYHNGEPFSTYDQDND
ncbi:unnamed protein product, partial [Meganyctiphanes norvegica]